MPDTISAEKKKAREDARKRTGQFGKQEHSGPQAVVVAVTPKEAALHSLRGVLEGHPDLIAHAEDFIRTAPGDFWRPDLAYVEYDDKLMEEQLDAYLTGDDDTLDGIDEMFREGEGYEDAINRYAEDLIGVELNDLEDYDLQDEVREWIQGMDESAVIPKLVEGNGDVLMQLPAAADDDAFGAALQAATEVDGEDERYEAIEKVFHDVLTTAGIELTDENKAAVRSLIDENSLDFGPQSSEQWRLRLVVNAAPKTVAMSSYGEHRDSARTLNIEDPSLLLVDPWNGRSHDVQLTGTYKTAVSTDRPARLDAVLGYGSLDNIAGVVRSAYSADITIEETAS